MFYDRFLELCKNKGVKPSPAATEAGISKSLVTKWKKNSSEVPSMDTVEKLAKYFGVPISDLLSDGLIRCEECGFIYDSSNAEERELHKTKHEARMKAVEKFGFCWDAPLREEKKCESRSVVNDDSKPIETRVDAQIVVIKALFSRSLTQNNFDLDHPSFEEYAAMILFQGKGKHSIPDEIYDRLTKRFGTKDGIPAGTIFRKINPPAGSISSRGNSVLESLNENELTLVYKYAEHLISLRQKK